MDAQNRIDKLIKENNNHPLLLSQEQIEFVFEEAITQIDIDKFDVFAMKNLEGVGIVILLPKKEKEIKVIYHDYEYINKNILKIKEK